MKPFKRILLGSHTWKVKWRQIEDTGGSFLYGRTSPRTTTIEINDNGVSLSQQQDAVVHEILHAIFSDRPAPWTDDFDQETLIKILTPGLVEALRRNPDVVKFILGE